MWFFLISWDLTRFVGISPPPRFSGKSGLLHGDRCRPHGRRENINEKMTLERKSPSVSRTFSFRVKTNAYKIVPGERRYIFGRLIIHGKRNPNRSSSSRLDLSTKHRRLCKPPVRVKCLILNVTRLFSKSWKT